MLRAFVRQYILRVAVTVRCCPLWNFDERTPRCWKYRIADKMHRKILRHQKVWFCVDEREREKKKRESSWGKSEIDGTWNLNCHQSFRRISNQFHFRWNNIIRENLLSIFFFFLKSVPSFSKLYYYYYFIYVPEIIRLLFCCVRYAEEVVNSARYTTLITLCICGVESVFGGIIFIGVSILQSYYPLLHGIN